MCRGGKYKEKDAKIVMIQILYLIAFCHLQGVVHRDLKPKVIKTLSTSAYTFDVLSPPHQRLLNIVCYRIFGLPQKTPLWQYILTFQITVRH